MTVILHTTISYKLPENLKVPEHGVTKTNKNQNQMCWQNYLIYIYSKSIYLQDVLSLQRKIKELCNCEASVQVVYFTIHITTVTVKIYTYCHILDYTKLQWVVHRWCGFNESALSSTGALGVKTLLLIKVKLINY